VSVELQAANQYGIRAIAGVTSGVMRQGETVTWKLRQYGIWVSHTSIISDYESPSYFQDRMIRGIFRSFEHNHFFHPMSAARTTMRDEVSFSLPFWLLGKVSEWLLVRRRIVDLLIRRNQLIKTHAEAAARCGSHSGNLD
jgi:ligand-binding SRPBCC domain-containing protein